MSWIRMATMTSVLSFFHGLKQLRPPPPPPSAFFGLFLTTALALSFFAAKAIGQFFHLTLHSLCAATLFDLGVRFQAGAIARIPAPAQTKPRVSLGLSARGGLGATILFPCCDVISGQGFPPFLQAFKLLFTVLK